MSGLLDMRTSLCYILCKVYLTQGGRVIALQNNVKRLREEHGLTQKELGEQVGVSRQVINAIETGKFDPSIWLAYDLTHFFGVSIETLFLFKEGDRK